MAKKKKRKGKKRGRKRLHSMHKAGFAGPVRRRGRPAKKSSKKKKTSIKQLAHLEKARKAIGGVAKHMQAANKRGLDRKSVV